MSDESSIRVTVEPRYHPERSRPEQSYWFFSYTVSIQNESQETVQLLSRHWVITDAEGRQEEVRGAGVIGEQPTLSPGESFRYTSFCPLSTSMGTMHGSYQLVTSEGRDIEAAIPAFTLVDPMDWN